MENTRGKLWIFGDSFSYGTGCLPEQDYLTQYPERRINKGIFPERLADTYKLQLKNLSFPGRSCQHILEDVIYNIPKFKPEDYLIIGLSDPVRITTWETWPAPHDVVKRVSINHYSCNTDCNPGDLYWNGSTEGMRKSTVDYIVNTLIPYREFEEVSYFNLVSTLVKGLTISKSFLWGATQWSAYETIYTDTNQKIKDYHFSWNGHKAFAADIISKFKIQDRVTLYPHYYDTPKKVFL
jgi:hypothetical protein